MDITERRLDVGGDALQAFLEDCAFAQAGTGHLFQRFRFQDLAIPKATGCHPRSLWHILNDLGRGKTELARPHSSRPPRW